MPQSAKRLPLAKANSDPDQLVGQYRPAGQADRQNQHDRPAGRNRPAGRTNPSVMAAVRRHYPQATAASLAVLTGQTLRAAERQLAEEREISTEGLVALLRSDLGFEVLEAVMNAVPAPSRPAWWRRLSRTASRAELRRQHAAISAKIDALEREEQLDLELRLAGPRGGGR